MRLNFINNFRAIYYNTLTNFYLYFNTFVPYYDDVILSLSITSFKNIINNNQISLKSIKENRLMKLIYFLDNDDKLVVDDDGFVFIDYHPKDICVSDEENDVNDEDVNDAVAEPITEPVAEPVVEPVVEPDVEPDVEPVAEPVAEPVVEPVAESVVEPVVEPDVEPVVEPVVEPDVEPVAEPVAEPVVESECYNSIEKKNN
jgi:hypothetical protein